MIRASPCSAGAQERAELHLEQLRLVEAHADRAPAEERIRLVRESAGRQLVAADVERPNHDRLAAERFDHPAIRAVLLFLVRHCRAADDEELRAHESNAFGAARRGETPIPPAGRRSRAA